MRRPTAAPGSISGTIRVDVAGNPARTLPARAAAVFARYPDITLQIGESERDVDLVREGVDCVIRGGHLPDSEMIAGRSPGCRRSPAPARPISPGTAPRIRLKD
ncbi:LysR substrate-binding domain-containing protein [Klebsiella pneumoniae]|uniref:LysR substrate-binding domain-containing protein n=1 Tax=Klebsiella pneumoniae TaxID=573 RepID=UPI0039064D44